MTLRRRLQAALLLAAFALAGAQAAQAALPTVPTPVHEAAPAATAAVGGGGLLQAGFGMLAVLGLIFLCAWAVRRFGLQRFGGGNVVKVVSSSMVGQRERVVVVEVGATWLVLGVTAQQVNTLHSMPAQAVPSAAALSSSQEAALRKPLDMFAQKLRESLTGRQRPTA